MGLTKNTWVAWSSGKDSALALQYLQSKKAAVTGLLTTITMDYERVSMHSTRKELLQLQARKLNLPLKIVEIPKDCSDETYKQKMSHAMLEAKDLGVEQVAFGDLFLKSVREYRENQLRSTRIKAIFPLWGKNTMHVSREIINNGFKAVVVAINKEKLPQALLGQEYDAKFLRELPSHVDPCGECPFGKPA
jgi:uncharacterized protein (TIGR00290 family)